MKMRKLTLMLMLAGCSAVTVNAYALSLGEADLESYLDQPLETAIPLLQVRDLNAQEILVNLASQEDFDKAGIERAALLSNLKFQVTVEPGKEIGTLRIFTTQPIKEPYLNFLVDVHWPSGHLVREYTLLMDPPADANLSTPTAKIEVTAPQPAVIVPDTSSPVVVPAPAMETTNPSVKPLVLERSASDVAPVQRPKVHATLARRRVHVNDMLWHIAAQLRPDRSVTIQQTMLAIQKHNPHAFIKGNINLIKAGAVLTAPSLKQIKAISVKEAKQEVVRQTHAWRSADQADVSSSASGKSLQAVQLESNNRNLTPKDKPASVKGGHLELLAAPNQNQSTAKKTTGLSSVAAEGEQKLALLGEQLDQSTLRLKDKQERLQEVGDQLNTSKKLIELKDDQVAALQNRLAELEGTEESSDTLVGGDTLAGGAEVTGVALPAEPTSTPIPAAVPQPIVQPSMEKIKQPAAVQPSGLPWYVNPWVWVGMLTLGSAVAAAAALWRRRQDADEEEFFDADDEEPEDGLMMQGTVAEAGATASTMVEEVLAQIDIDLAYGRYQRAIKALEQAIKQAPDQMTLRMKLLEVYAETADQQAFDQQAEQLQALGDAEIDSRIAALKKRLIEEQQSAAPASVVAPIATPPAPVIFATVPEVSVASTSAEHQLLPDFDFNPQDLPATSIKSAEMQPAVKEEMVFTLDDDVDFGKELEQMEASLRTAETAQPKAGDAQPKAGELLDALDFPELDDVVSGSVPSAGMSSDEWNMDFNGELGFDSSDMDEVETKLDLARAYLDMGDKEGARDILGEVVAEGSSDQQQQAKDLLAKLESL